MKRKNILIINGHPMKNTFNDALANEYEQGSKEVHHSVRTIKLSTTTFNPVLQTFDPKKEPNAKLIASFQKDISWADHIVVFYPTWWTAMPALLKGFFDKVFSPGFAYKFIKGKPMPKKLLKGKSAHIITTLDAPPLIYKVLYRSAGTFMLKKGIFKFCGIKPVKTTLIGSVKFSNETKRTKWLVQMRKYGHKAR